MACPSHDGPTLDGSRDSHELSERKRRRAMELPAVNLKAIVLTHWLLTIWACMATPLPSSYAWGNVTVFAVGVWAIAQRDSIDAVVLFLVGLALTILTDIIHFSVVFPLVDLAKSADFIRFSVGMAILSLILKPLSCFLVYLMYRERGGDSNLNFGFLNAAQDRSAYQDIERQVAPTEQDGKAQPRPY